MIIKRQVIFMKSSYERLYKKAKNIMEDKTPLKNDCGFLCNKACCKGDTETGMLLFPFEETTLTVSEKDSVRLCVCEGSCKRESRPLSCMIFPFFPILQKKAESESFPISEAMTSVLLCVIFPKQSLTEDF